MSWRGDEWWWSPPSQWPRRGATQWPGDYVGSGGSQSTLAMSDEDKAAARRREREKGTFGFARVLDDETPSAVRVAATRRYA